MSIRPNDEILQEPFWKALAQGQLRMQRCCECGTFRHPPSPICHKCASFEMEWTPLGGGARLYSFTVARQSVHTSLDAKMPYDIALVDLDEGVRMVSSISGIAASDLRIGMRLKCSIEKVSADFALPYFVPEPETKTP